MSTKTQLDKLFLGSGGGGGPNPSGNGTRGGNGGGIIFIAADRFNTWTGSITSKGQAGGNRGSSGGAAGGGAGGSIRIEGQSINMGGSVTVTGSLAGTGGSAGAGGAGRMAVYYQDFFYGPFTPNYIEKAGHVDSIFSDGFESGGLLPGTPEPPYGPSAWSALSSDSTHLSVVPEAAYWGYFGLQVNISGTNDQYAQDNTPDSESQYRARFYVNPSGVTMASGDILDLFNGYSAVGVNVFHVQMKLNGSTYQVHAGAYNGSTWTDSGWSNLVSGWNALQIAYLPGSNFDDFDSRRFSDPGLLNDPGTYRSSLYTFTSQPDETSGTDTYLSNANPTTNYGTDSSIYVGESNANSTVTRGLIKFDLSNIPTNATVVNATLYLTVTANAADNARTLRVYRLLHSWDESTATWNVSSTGTTWGTAGAWGTTDTDSVETGSVSVPANPTVGTVITIPLSSDELTKLVNGTNANYGWLLKMDTENNDKHNYASSSSTTPSMRPRLVIGYSTAADIPPEWTDRTYTYSHDQRHAAVADSTGAAYDYDNNGNMTSRVEGGRRYQQSYNTEHQLTQVELWNNSTLLATWNFFYDGDGNRVRQEYFQGVFGQNVTVKVTNYYAGGAYEQDQTGIVQADDTILISGTITRKYYAFAGQTVAMVVCGPQGCGAGLKYFLTDHLGSVVAVVNSSGGLVSRQGYYPYGGIRTDVGTVTQIDFGDTEQNVCPDRGILHATGFQGHPVMK